MKWVLNSPGNYRLVDNDDERPEVKLPGKKLGTPHIAYTPSWKKYEEGMHHPDNKKQAASGDKFFAEREHALKTDPQARRYEESRKEAWAKEKPQWIREHAND